MKMSSINLNHICGLSGQFASALVSNLSMNSKIFLSKIVMSFVFKFTLSV